MEKRETQAQKRAGRASAVARWLPLASASAVLVAGAVMAAPAGGGLAANSRLAADATVQAGDDFFMPSTVTINQGETVTWTNTGTNPHNVHFQDGFVDPPTPDPSGWSRSRRFDAAGSFSYRCDRHPNMTGTVTVNPAPPPPGGYPPPGGTPPPGGGAPPPGAPPGAPGAGKASSKVTLQVGERTPARGAHVRFFGTVRPAQDGRRVQLQRRVGANSYRTVARIKLADAGASRSKFSKRLRVLKDTVFRARLPGDSTHAVGVSRTRRVDVR